MLKKLTIYGLEGIPLVKAGDDLASLILEAAKNNNIAIEDGDILVVAQKVISKAEDRIVNLDTITPSKRALSVAEETGKDPRLLELVLRESKRVLKASHQIVVVEDKREIVNINAGIDKSNIRGTNHYALLPLDPDKSARELQSRINQLINKQVGIIVSDTYSRAFRRGQVNFAIGISGVAPFVDYRGKEDLFGYIMQVKFSTVADELASAAELVMGQGNEAVPVAIVKGLNLVNFSEGKTSKDLVISEEEDLFKSVW